MALSLDEIKDKAVKFSKKFENATSEKSEAKEFISNFLNIFGVDSYEVGKLEYPVDEGYMDYLWPGVIGIEMKSAGKKLKDAYEQLEKYVAHLDKDDFPKLLMVSDLQNIWVFHRTKPHQAKFATKELVDYVEEFELLAGMVETKKYDKQEEVNVKASEKMAKLHKAMRAGGYDGHKLQVYLVRLLFCLFADDSGIFYKNIFFSYIENSKEDGSDLDGRLNKLFQVLNMPPEERAKQTILQKTSPELFLFPYVNGGLFAEVLVTPAFDAKMRQTLLEACHFNWKNISPAIFGAMFQGVMNAKERHDLGAHYTSEENILKVINPLFMDELWEEFHKVKTSPSRLRKFHSKLSSLKFLDPACGCGNFLIIAYQKLRELEIEINKILKKGESLAFDTQQISYVRVSQFYGIEIEEFPCQVARVGMWLMNHLMNLKMREFGETKPSVPLVDSANIVCGNALTMDWNEVVLSSELSYILGNPPFVGGKIMKKEQKQEILNIVGKVNRSASIDYVVAWYYKAAEYIQGTKIKVAFVSTNSICQGAQIEPIWRRLLEEYKVVINFAYRSFKWNNEAKANAIVHCVIIGFSLVKNTNKFIFENDKCFPAKNINPYLWDAQNAYIMNRSTPLCNVPQIDYGNMPNDGGHYIFSKEEMENFIKYEPQSKKFFKIFQGAEDYIYGNTRYCLWLNDITAIDVKDCPKVRERISLVKEHRLNSTAKPTRDKAKTPHKFFYISHPNSNYLLIPLTSSEKRDYIPIGFASSNIVASNAASIIANASLYHFGILTSSVHMIWIKLVAGRLELRYRYSGGIVYNNFPWIENVTDEQKAKIEKYAQAVLDARANHPKDTLAGMYGDVMPDDLLKAHNVLDREVMKLYGYTKDTTKNEIVADLLNRYEKLVKKEWLTQENKPKKARKKSA